MYKVFIRVRLCCVFDIILINKISFEPCNKPNEKIKKNAKIISIVPDKYDVIHNPIKLKKIDMLYIFNIFIIYSVKIIIKFCKKNIFLFNFFYIWLNNKHLIIFL